MARQIILVSAVLLLGLVLYVFVAGPAIIANPIFWSVVLSCLFGAATGASEIISRYRDEPTRATLNKFGLSYLAANAAMSLGAYGLIEHYSGSLFPAMSGDWFMKSVVAGFGAMAIVRSKLFIFRSEDGKEYPIGPAIVIETFLRMLDRKIDRHRASRRQAIVSGRMKDISDFEASADYLTASLLSFQNLTEEEKTSIARVIAEYREAEWPSSLQVMAIGFAFLTIAGEENFDQVIGSLSTYLQATRAEVRPAAPPQLPPQFVENPLITPVPPAPLPPRENP